MTADLDIQGHRGCRGLYPENTIGGFKKALDLGVRTLEMDVVISKDHQVVISHEPFFNHEISQDSINNPILEQDEKKHNIYALDYDEILKYDVGLQPHPRFDKQSNIAATKPLLSEMFNQIEEYKKQLGREVYYNIEIKRVKEQDGVFHPEVSVFVDLVLDVIAQSDCTDRVSVQCFDHQGLQEVHKLNPEIQTVLLIGDEKPIVDHLELLGFIPTIYSPNYTLVDAQLVEYCHSKGMRVIPWTVNTEAATLELISFDVDGIISDYPDMTIDVWEGLRSK